MKNIYTISTASAVTFDTAEAVNVETAKNVHIETAEAVRAGHPDKLCDQIADALLDEYLRGDPSSRVALEVMATENLITIGGEVTSNADVDYSEVVNEVIRSIGYKHDDLVSHSSENMMLRAIVKQQSPDIAQAVDDHYMDLGAGDQGVMVGYATNETASMMPRAYTIAQRICRLLDEEAKVNPMFGVDGKAQVSLIYEGDEVFVHTIVVSVQHAANAGEEKLRGKVTELVKLAAGRADMWRDEAKLLINPSGRFVVGGLAADTGMTGRKLAVDMYGPTVRMGGGALSGKDATKVDRSGAYAARWVAKSLVTAGLCQRCEVQVAYAIGEPWPVCMTINSFNTGKVPDERLSEIANFVFDLRPAAIIRSFGLTRPLYRPLSIYGHFGRSDLYLPWEHVGITMVRELRYMANESVNHAKVQYQ